MREADSLRSARGLPAAPADFVFGFFVPALVGNIIGVVSLVAAIAHAQRASDGAGATDT